MSKPYLTALLLTLVLTSCGDRSTEEYFCEYKRSETKNLSSAYFQTSIKVNDSEMCIFHRGNEYCSKYDEKTQGYIDDSDWDKNLSHSEFYIASHDADTYTFKVFDKNILRDDAKVDSKLVNGEWHFSFSGHDLTPTLQDKDSTNESQIIFKMAAIENADKNSGVFNSFVSKKSPNLPPKNKDEELVFSFIGQPSDFETVFQYGNEKYNSIKDYVNGNHLHSTYVFNKKQLNLVDTPEHPYKTEYSDGIFRSKCEVWKKPKWYEFP